MATVHCDTAGIIITEDLCAGDPKLFIADDVEAIYTGKKLRVVAISVQGQLWL